MGVDKAFVSVDGRPMAARVADALEAAGAVSVTALGGDADRLSELGLTHVADVHPGEGPLGAVVQALASIGGESLVAVAPCDLLHPEPALIDRLLDARGRADADVAVPVVDGRAQWAQAVWHRRLARLLADVFASGERSLVGAVAGVRVERVTDVEPAWCADADAPGDLPQPLG